MWVITVFELNSFRIFEYEDKKEATLALQNFKDTAILSLCV